MKKEVQVLKENGQAWLGYGHFRGGVGDILALLGQVQEDDRLDRFGGDHGTS